MNFYTHYLTGWLGLGLFFVLAYVAGYLARRIFRWAFPQYYMEMTRHDETVTALHDDIAELVGLLTFLAYAVPTAATVLTHQDNIFKSVLLGFCLLMAIEVLIALESIRGHLKRLRPSGDEYMGGDQI